jgi:hypothetical protein
VEVQTPQSDSSISNGKQQSHCNDQAQAQQAQQAQAQA